MTALLLTAPPPDESVPASRIGGRPHLPATIAWPARSECHQPLQFFAQIRLRDVDPDWPDRWLLLFVCHTPETYCEVGRVQSGGNRALCVAVHDAAPGEPPVPAALRRLEGLRLEPCEPDYDAARTPYLSGDPFVYGHVGEPAGSVSGFIPECPDCHSPMRFVAQFEEGPDVDSAMPFNGTTAFAYVCAQCFERAAMFVDDFF